MSFLYPTCTRTHLPASVKLFFLGVIPRTPVKGGWDEVRYGKGRAGKKKGWEGRGDEGREGVIAMDPTGRKSTSVDLGLAVLLIEEHPCF